jgi:hypothetical protein
MGSGDCSGSGSSTQEHPEFYRGKETNTTENKNKRENGLFFKPK